MYLILVLCDSWIMDLFLKLVCICDYGVEGVFSLFCLCGLGCLGWLYV